MAAPKGRTYTPTRGPLAGITFTAPEGLKSGYYAYQQARSQLLGFQRGYQQERVYTRDPVSMKLEQRLRSATGLTRAQARQRVAATGFNRKSNGQNVVRWAIDEGLFDYGDDAADYIYYE